MNKKQIIFSFIAIVIIIAGVFVSATIRRKAIMKEGAADQSAVREAVTAFGQKLQLVSLLAPSSDIKASMDAEYAPYVAPALLLLWENDPLSAPGRTVSSPWPDSIEITKISANADGSYTVTGLVIEVTSTEVRNGTSADTYPVTMTMQKHGNVWLIDSLLKGAITITPVPALQQ